MDSPSAGSRGPGHRHRRGGASVGSVPVEDLVDALPSPTLLLDVDGTILLANAAWADLANHVGDERLRFRVGDDYLAAVRRVAGDTAGGAIVGLLQELSHGDRRSGTIDFGLPGPQESHWYHLQASRVGSGAQLVVTQSDITSRVQAHRASIWQARHDDLTALPNRAHLHELIDVELQRADRPAVSVLFLDVDGFKDVNDSLGHEVGDELLRQLATRLHDRTRGQDTVGRLGGDEFVVLCRDCDTAGAEGLARRCQQVFDRPFLLSGRSVRLGVSIGIASVQAADRPRLRSTDLVRNADLAMYAAKAAGRNRIRVFSVDLHNAVQRKVQLATELREAIDAGQFVLHYQPLLHLSTGAIDGVEALIRWQHPERGLIPPEEFIGLAEQHELIAPLTRWVLGTATCQAAQWTRLGFPLVVAVNVSAAALADGSLVGDVGEALDSSGLPPEQLIVELTETSIVGDPRAAADQFAALRISGVEVSIDDFGAGYSSLGQLVNIPAGLLKIDRSLVAEATHPRSPGAAAIAAVVSLARSCGMRSLAEGIETPEQLAVARGLGCTFAQGYHIARPMPPAKLLPWLAGCGARAQFVPTDRRVRPTAETASKSQDRAGRLTSPRKLRTPVSDLPQRHPPPPQGRGDARCCQRRSSPAPSELAQHA